MRRGATTIVGLSTGRARRLVANWQERAYGELAVEFGLGWQPRAAYDALNPPVTNDASDAIDFVGSMYGGSASTDWGAWKYEIERTVEPHIPGPSAPFESVSFVIPASYYLSRVLDSSIWEPYRPFPTPFVATLPTVGMNPLTRVFTNSAQAVIILQHGVLGYLMHVASVLASALPRDWFPWRPYPLLSSLLEPGGTLQVLRAQDHLRRVLLAYVVSGTPNGIQSQQQVGQTRENRMEIFQSATVFLLAHEVSHLALGHLDPSDTTGQEEAWHREFLGDRIGVLTTMALDRTGVHAEVAALGSVVALLATEALLSCVTYLSTGDLEVTGTATHPPPAARVAQLVNGVSADVERGEHQDIGNLTTRLGRVCDLLRGLVDTCLPALDDLRRAGTQPSPVWRLSPSSTARGTNERY